MLPADDRRHPIHVEAGTTAEVQRLGQALDEARYADLVDHLGELPRSGATDEYGDLGVGVDDGLDAGVDVLVTTAHHCQLAVLGPSLATRNRSVDEPHSHHIRSSPDLTGHLGRGCGVVDQRGTGFHSG